MKSTRLPPWGRLRFATPADAAGILAVYAPYVENTAVTFEYTVPTLATYQARMAEIQTTYPFLVWDEPDGIKGYAYAHRFGTREAYSWVAELSIYTHPAVQGTGVAEALYRALLQLVREQGVWRAYAIVTWPNPASRRFHEKLGFRVFGQFPNAGYKLGQWYDVLHMELALREGQANPTPLVPIDDLPQVLVNDILRRYGGR